MRIKHSLAIAAAGVMIMMILMGCGGTKYKLNFDGYGFESKKTQYVAGDKVTVYYDLIATDTDYTFWIDKDVEMKQSYDDAHGYVFTFSMPAHDVTMGVESHNSMEYFPGPGSITEDEIAEVLDESSVLFDYYEETTATVGGDGYDEIVLYEYPSGTGMIMARYSRSGGNEETRRLCIVPESVLDRCMAVVGSCGMREWKDTAGMTGRIYVVKFKDGDNLRRVSSEEMPEDGMDAFNEIREIIFSSWEAFGPEQ